MMRLGEAAAAVRGELIGEDLPFGGVSTDSRSLRAGELFVALRGEHFDGHDVLDAVKAAGAAAAIIDRRHAQAAPLPVIVVEDTKLALGDLARDWRARFRPALIGVAGSNGKTTTKEMIAAILRSHAGDEQVLATAGNLNNEIGVPLTLLRLRAAHRYCAIELGMNHKGEIGYLAGIARPTIAVVTNAQREHQEFMHSVDEVAEENAAVYRALPADGVAVVNADDAHADVFRAAARPRRTIGFALEDGAPDARAADSRAADSHAEVRGGYSVKPFGSEIRLRTPAGELSARLAIPGQHNVRNALAAAACAHAAGIGAAAIRAGLEAFRPYTGRLQIKRALSGATVIDDSYNANPDSVRAAIDVLASCAQPTVLVLGDMGEVGDQGPAFHREVGGYARAKGVGALLGIGEATRDAVEAFGANGVHAASIDELIEQARARAEPRATLLVKGSRFMRMERVVAALAGAAQGGGH